MSLLYCLFSLNLHQFKKEKYMMNPWHDISVGIDVPEIVTGIIEIPKNTRAKYELDKESGTLEIPFRSAPIVAYKFTICEIY